MGIEQNQKLNYHNQEHKMAMDKAAVLKEMKENLTCFVCWEVFSDPHWLECHHTYCGSCIEKLTKNKQVLCPTCRKISGANKTEKNFQMRNLIEMYKRLKDHLEDECGPTSYPQSFIQTEYVESQCSLRSISSTVERSSHCLARGTPESVPDQLLEVQHLEREIKSKKARAILAAGRQADKCVKSLQKSEEYHAMQIKQWFLEQKELVSCWRDNRIESVAKFYDGMLLSAHELSERLEDMSQSLQDNIPAEQLLEQQGRVDDEMEKLRTAKAIPFSMKIKNAKLEPFDFCKAPKVIRIVGHPNDAQDENCSESRNSDSPTPPSESSQNEYSDLMRLSLANEINIEDEAETESEGCQITKANRDKKVCPEVLKKEVKLARTDDDQPQQIRRNRAEEHVKCIIQDESSEIQNKSLNVMKSRSQSQEYNTYPTVRKCLTNSEEEDQGESLDTEYPNSESSQSLDGLVELHDDSSELTMTSSTCSTCSLGSIDEYEYKTQTNVLHSSNTASSFQHPQLKPVKPCKSASDITNEAKQPLDIIKCPKKDVAFQNRAHKMPISLEESLEIVIDQSLTMTSDSLNQSSSMPIGIMNEDTMLTFRQKALTVAIQDKVPPKNRGSTRSTLCDFPDQAGSEGGRLKNLYLPSTISVPNSSNPKSGVEIIGLEANYIDGVFLMDFISEGTKLYRLMNLGRQEGQLSVLEHPDDKPQLLCSKGLGDAMSATISHGYIIVASFNKGLLQVSMTGKVRELNPGIYRHCRSASNGAVYAIRLHEVGRPVYVDMLEGTRVTKTIVTALGWSGGPLTSAVQIMPKEDGGGSYIYICSKQPDDCIHKIDLRNGNTIAVFGFEGTGGPGQLNWPYLCSWIDKQNLLVADRENDRLQVLNTTASQWGILTNFKAAMKPRSAVFNGSYLYVGGHNAWMKVSITWSQ